MLKAGDEEIETTTTPAQMEKATTRTISVQSHENEPQQQQQPMAPVSPPSIRTSPEKISSGQQSKPFSRMQAKVKFIPEGRKGQLNTQYLATLPGILKIVETILGFVAFILAICADRRFTSTGWTEHITFETTLVVSIFLLLYVVFPHLTLLDERTREGMLVVELLFYGLNTLFFFIGIWLMVQQASSVVVDGKGAAIMNAILCLALCVLYGAETYMKFKGWNVKGASRSQTPQGQHQVPPAPTHQHQGGKDHVVV